MKYIVLTADMYKIQNLLSINSFLTFKGFIYNTSQTELRVL